MRKDWTLVNAIQKNTGSISKKNDEFSVQLQHIDQYIQRTAKAYTVTQAI